MRPKIAMIIIGIGLTALIGLSLLRSNHQRRPTDPSLIAQRTAAEQEKTASSNPQVVASNSTPDAKAIPEIWTAASRGDALKNGSQQAARGQDEYIQQRVGELYDLGMSDSPEALKTILSEVTNPEGEIRKAAIEAAKQFGSTNAIPSLEDAISTSESLEDRQDLREAIEFLKLPSFLAKRN